MKQLTIPAIAVAALLAAVGCGGSRPSTGPASYLAATNSKVAFVQWRATPHGHLRGTLTAGTAARSAPDETLSVSQAPFRGTISGNSVTLTFAVPYFLQARAHGTLSGDMLTLRFPQPDGTMARATFRQSDVTSYTDTVARVRRTIRSANLAAARQLAEHAKQPARGVPEQDAQRSLSALYRDSSLASDGALARDLTRIAGHIHTARSDLATEKHDAAAGNRYCKAAFTATGDAASVDGDLATVQGDVTSMMADVVIVRKEAVIAQAAVRKLARTRVQVPSSAYQVIADARTRLSRAIAVANSYIDQINALASQARSMANRLATGSCSGARSGSWAPLIAHVS